MERSREIARLSAEIRQRQQAYAQRPRHKYITANTREHVTAMYEEAWRSKVERIGNLNYPDEAKRRNLSGSLILDVAIKADGSLHGVRILESSGYKVLDDGAARIVKLAAPFSPFPPAIREETDILHIIRTWQFHSNNSLETRGR
jgi:protein TonB